VGVCSCSVQDCSNIMCDAIVDGRYVCDDCIQEFQKRVGHEPKPEAELLDLFRDFRDTGLHALKRANPIPEDYKTAEDWLGTIRRECRKNFGLD